MIVSDNAKTFQASANEIQKVIRSESVQCYLTNQHIDWQFMVEKGTLVGEFLGEVGQECQALFKEDTSLKFDEMATLIVEI